MRTKDHGNWGHGLRGDEERDINCVSCRREDEPCDRGTPGCSVGRHAGDTPCETW